MSVLSFPRIYFTGYMCWDPATGNNNQDFPTYDDVHASLNWDFFTKNGINITPANFRTSFRPWLINNQTIDGKTAIPGEWNLFGGNGAYFVQYVDPSKHIEGGSLITGGMLNVGERVANDPLIGTPVTLLGDPFGDPAPSPPGRLVDNNPVAVYSTQIFYNNMTFGTA